jgi:hypothetical protein
LSDFQKGRTNVIFDVVAHLSPNLDLACKVFDYGAKKYATWNWAKGMPWSVPLACIGRHLKAIKDGEEVDAESGVHHAGHILCNVIMLAHFAAHYPEGDDRPLKTCFKEPVYEG